MVVWLGTADGLRHRLGGGQCGVLPHVVGAGLDPDGVVDDPVHDCVRVNTGAEALVPVLLRAAPADIFIDTFTNVFGALITELPDRIRPPGGSCPPCFTPDPSGTSGSRTGLHCARLPRRSRGTHRDRAPQ